MATLPYPADLCFAMCDDHTIHKYVLSTQHIPGVIIPPVIIPQHYGLLYEGNGNITIKLLKYVLQWFWICFFLVSLHGD